MKLDDDAKQVCNEAGFSYDIAPKSEQLLHIMAAYIYLVVNGIVDLEYAKLTHWLEKNPEAWTL